MTTTVGKARIDIEVDGSGISKSLEAAMDRALAAVSKSADAAFGKVEKDAAAAGDEIGSGIGDGAKAAERALSSIDTDGIDNISKAAADAADSVSKSSSDAADSLSDVGAAGAEAGATASGAMASSMADVTSAAATAGARAADSLSGVGGAASEAGATASGAMAGSMADISASAASAFSAVSASAADAAGGVAASAANMSSSMSGAMSSIQGAASGAVGAVGSAGGGLGNLARKAGPAAAALAGVATAGATVKAGFDKLTSIEDTTASLGIILGDLDQATALMDKLQEDNLTTPYMFDAYAGAGKTLAAFGADLEGIPEQVRALGEAAAASGGGQAVFDSMARASGQAMATGKMSLDTINQLAVGGVQGLQILANHFDVPTAEMQKMISQGMVPAQEGMDILTQGILEGSDGIAGATQSMSGVMQEMSETTSGSMTNLLAGFTNLASAGIQPLLPAIQALADGMTKLSYFIIDIINGDLDGWMGTVLDIAKPLSITIGALTAAVAALVLQQKIAAAGGFLKWLGSFNAITKISTAVQAAFNAVMAANPITLIVIAIAALVAGLVYFFTQTETGKRIWEQFMNGLRIAWEWIKNVFAGVWEVVSDHATSAFQWISDAWDTLWSGIQAVWEAVGQPVVDFVVAAFQLWWEGVQLSFRLLGAAWEVLWTGLQMAWEAFGQPVVDFVVAAFQFWWDGVQLTFRLLGAAWEVLWTGLQIAWDTFGQPIIDFIVAAFQMWWDGVQIVFGWVQTGWDMLWAGVRMVYDTVIAPVIQWVQDRFNDLRNGVSIAIEFVKTAIQEFADRVSALYDTYVQPMVDAVIGGFNRIRDTIQEWKDKIIGWFSDAGTWLLDAGKNIVGGIINGVKSMAGELANAFLNIVPDWVKGPFMEAMGIASPSKVFIGYGKSIGEGLVEGIESMEGAVGDAVTDLTDSATPGDLPPMPVSMALDADSSRLAAPLAAPAAVSDPAPMSAPTMPEIGTRASVDLDATGLAGVMGEAGESVVAAREGMIDPALAGMAENLTGLAETAGLEGQKLTEAMNLAGIGVLTAKDTLVDPALWGMQANLAQTALTTQQQMLGMALPAMQMAGLGVVAVQNDSVAPALTNMQGSVAQTQRSFAAGASGINAEWNRIREGTASPARFVISTVFNDGIVGMWNSVSDLIDTPKMSPWPLRFATGGHVRGPGGPTDDKIPAWLSNGEYVLKTSTVKRLGVGTLNALNSGAYTIAPGTIRSPQDGERMAMDRTIAQMAKRYAGGGVVEGDATWKRFKKAHDFGKRWNNAPYVYGGSLGSHGGTDCSGWVSSIADVVHGGTGLQRQWATGSFPGGGGVQGSSGPQGFVAGLGGGLSTGVSTIHAAGTLGGVPGLPNVNVESGGAHDYTAYGGPSVGADHSQFPTRYHLSIPGLGMFRSGGGGGNGIATMVSDLIGEKSDALQKSIDGYSGPGYAGQLPSAIGTKMREATEKKIADLVAEVAGGMDGDPESWRPMVIRALIRQGYADLARDPAIVDKFIRQIATESNGIEGRIQEIVDVNGTGEAAGVGLGQIIPGTFAAWRDPALPNDRKDGWANINAMVRYVMGTPGKLDWIGNGVGYDRGGIANGIGLMPKHVLDPERVLSPRQTEAFEAWMDAGARVEDINKLVEAVTWREDPANLPVVQPEKVLNKDQEAVFDEWREAGSQIDSVHELVDSMHGLQLDHPEVMGREIDRRFRAWLGEAPEDNTGDVRHLVAALEAGVEWERVTRGMQRSAEAWANGQWVQVGKDKRLATPAEMGQQVSENFLEELADELGGYVGLRGLYKGRDIVGESGLVKLELPDEVKDAEIVPSTEGAPVVATATPTATGKTTAGENQNVEVTVNIDVSGVNDPMAVSDLVMAKVGKGVEEAIGTARSQ